ncbi:hypothetical protein AB0D34_42135 [Streptomyces sp. NPDC048420]|uniref:hypothetical protein n=1 Tax=Streptomyces sp. NPDC048420 TaxID=3155755 RepID=UPI00341C0958
MFVRRGDHILDGLTGWWDMRGERLPGGGGQTVPDGRGVVQGRGQAEPLVVQDGGELGGRDGLGALAAPPACGAASTSVIRRAVPAARAVTAVRRNAASPARGGSPAVEVAKSAGTYGSARQTTISTPLVLGVPSTR